jgi:uncharacterized protein (DUF2249 family)
MRIKVFEPSMRYLHPVTSSMATPSPLRLDVRPLCETRQPPLPAILEAISRLAPGQAFQLIAPFEPTPLYQLLGQQGFTATTRETGDGAWEIIFSRQ